MPAHPRVPDPAEGPLQAFAYDLRKLGHGNVSVAWIARHPDTKVSRATLYAALSGTRLPRVETVSTLLRWWVGIPLLEAERLDERFLESPWAWMWRVRDGERRQMAELWRTRYGQLEREINFERESRPRAASVTITVPLEQQRFIDELRDAIRNTGHEHDLWLLFGALGSRVERYLAGDAIPTDDTCELVAQCLAQALPLEAGVLRLRLMRSAVVARAARTRERRIARRSKTSST